MEVSDVIHSDWGFEPKALDEAHASKPMLVVGSKSDDIHVWEESAGEVLESLSEDGMGNVILVGR